MGTVWDLGWLLTSIQPPFWVECVLLITFLRTAAITYRHKMIFSMVKFDRKNSIHPYFCKIPTCLRQRFPRRLIFSNQKFCGNLQTFIASYSLKYSLKSVLLSKEICTTIPKKGEKWWDTKYVQRFTKVLVQSSVSGLVKLKWDLHYPVVNKHFEKISSYNIAHILTQTSDF